MQGLKNGAWRDTYLQRDVDLFLRHVGTREMHAGLYSNHPLTCFYELTREV